MEENKAKDLEKAETEQQEQKQQKDKHKVIKTILFIVLIVIIILLLLRSCGTDKVDTESTNNPVGQEQIDAPQGNFEVGGKREEQSVEDETPDEIEYITFTGFGKFTVSADSPSVELSNPDKNTADFIFTLTDKASGEVIARTGKVHPGEYVYANVVDYYKTAGSYDVTVDIEAYSKEDVQLNGLTQEMIITVQ